MLNLKRLAPASKTLNILSISRSLRYLPEPSNHSKRIYEERQHRKKMQEEHHIKKNEGQKRRRIKQQIGPPKSQAEIRTSKALSWVLRHGAVSEGLYMRPDGYVRVTDLLSQPKFRQLDFLTLERIVQADEKMRYHLLLQADPEEPDKGDIWWIRANQGHSMQNVALDLTQITDPGQVPMAVHGTTLKAWQSIEFEGLSRMNRNHIHLAQGIGRDFVISGMRSSSQIYIFIDLVKAMAEGIKFHLSHNGVVLSEGDERGFIPPSYFLRVTHSNRQPLPGWEGSQAWKDMDVNVVEKSEGGLDDTREPDIDKRQIEPDQEDETTINEK